jgi:hypothetical protein
MQNTAAYCGNRRIYRRRQELYAGVIYYTRVLYNLCDYFGLITSAIRTKSARLFATIFFIAAPR